MKIRSLRKLFSLIAICIFFNLFIAKAILADPEESKADKIKIGVVSALTGESSPTGLDVADAIRFANNEFGHNKYELLFEDDHCTGKDGISVAQKFISVEQVKYVLGFACSAATLPAARLYDQAKILSIAASASSPKISLAGDYIFRTSPNDLDAGRILGRYAAVHFKNIGMLAEQTDYAQHIGDVFEDSVKLTSNILRVDFLPNTLDIKPLILEFKRKNIDAIFINAQAEKTFALILKQIKSMDIKVQILGAYWPGSPALLDIARDELEGTVFIDTPLLDNILTPEGRDVFNKYKSSGGIIRSVEAMFATSVESFRALDAAIQSHEDPKEYLYTHKFHGIFGDYSFDKNGDILGMNLVLKKILHGSPVLLDKAD